MSDPDIPHLKHSDTVYSELYAEMRRFRDYEFIGSTWYSAILVAMIAGILTVRNEKECTPLSNLLFDNCKVQVLVSVLAMVLAFVAVRNVCYCRFRYCKLREWTEAMEPRWKARLPVELSKDNGFQPHFFLLATPIALAFLVIAIFIWA